VLLIKNGKFVSALFIIESAWKAVFTYVACCALVAFFSQTKNVYKQFLICLYSCNKFMWTC